MQPNQLSKAQQMLYSGEFSSMSQQWQSDGSCIVTIVSKDGASVVQSHVSALYEDAESVLSEKVLPTAHTATVAARFAAAAAQVAILPESPA